MTSLLPFVIPFAVYEMKKKGQRRIYVCSYIINDDTSIYFYSRQNSIPGDISFEKGKDNCSDLSSPRSRQGWSTGSLRGDPREVGQLSSQLPL